MDIRLNSDKIKSQQMKSAIRGAEQVIVSLKSYSLTDEEFGQLSKHMTMVMQTLYVQRSDKSKQSTAAFKEAMKWLKTIRK